MADATLTTKQVTKIVEEEQVVLTMTREEAEAVHNIIWLTEIAGSKMEFFMGAKRVQSALRNVVQPAFAPTKLRFDVDHIYNDGDAVYLIENES